jgi:antitoxin component YwqK of YwqJK toxin-antitoxin module
MKKLLLFLFLSLGLTSISYGETQNTYYENGQKESEVNYKDGEKDGKYTAWYENGQKGEERNYKDGKEDGKVTLWYENGQKKLEGNYKDDKKDGKFTWWYENGQKEQVTYFKDDDEVKVTVWHKNGQKRYEKNYKDGERDGKTTRWYKNGQKEGETNYKDGKQDGKRTEWYANGQIKSEENYKDGIKIQLDENKQMKSAGNYKNDSILLECSLSVTGPTKILLDTDNMTAGLESISILSKLFSTVDTYYFHNQEYASAQYRYKYTHIINRKDLSYQKKQYTVEIETLKEWLTGAERGSCKIIEDKNII